MFKDKDIILTTFKETVRTLYNGLHSEDDHGYDLYKWLKGKETEVVEAVCNKLEIPNPPNYDPNFGDNRLCKCDHTYYRHFDSHDNMEPIGCKYCFKYDANEKLWGNNKCSGFQEQESQPLLNDLHLCHCACHQFHIENGCLDCNCGRE